MLLISFFKAFLKLVASTLGYRELLESARLIPASLQKIKSQFGLEEESFTKVVVCPKCHSLYPFTDVANGSIRKCRSVRWPNHKQESRRKPCGKILTVGGTNNPKKVYAYRHIKQYLASFLQRPNFLNQCNEWRKSANSDDYYGDIYDGNHWKIKHKEYLSSPYNLLGMINVDWFQPFKHSPYSLGAIYMVTLNLPRNVRFKEDNVMLLGVVPGPNEPSLHMNTYLKPIVDELLLFDCGVWLQDQSPLGNKYRYRLLGFSCDLPACRKIGGMVSFSAKYGKLCILIHILL